MTSVPGLALHTGFGEMLGDHDKHWAKHTMDPKRRIVADRRSRCHNRTGAAALRCFLCQTGKDERFCPALHGPTGAQWCGREREPSLDWRADCAYLLQPRGHEKPRFIEGLQPVELFRDIALEEKYLFDHEPLITQWMFGIAEAVVAHQDWTGADLIHALTQITCVAATVADSGLILQESTPGPAEPQGVIATSSSGNGLT